jgi:hypothetical protein
MNLPQALLPSIVSVLSVCLFRVAPQEQAPPAGSRVTVKVRNGPPLKGRFVRRGDGYVEIKIAGSACHIKIDENEVETVVLRKSAGEPNRQVVRRPPDENPEAEGRRDE